MFLTVRQSQPRMYYINKPLLDVFVLNTRDIQGTVARLGYEYTGRSMMLHVLYDLLWKGTSFTIYM